MISSTGYRRFVMQLDCYYMIIYQNQKLHPMHIPRAAHYATLPIYCVNTWSNICESKFWFILLFWLKFYQGSPWIIIFSIFIVNSYNNYNVGQVHEKFSMHNQQQYRHYQLQTLVDCISFESYSNLAVLLCDH